jgi:hypothetical protein
LILLTKINIRQIAGYQDYHWSQFVRRFDQNNIFSPFNNRVAWGQSE